MSWTTGARFPEALLGLGPIKTPAYPLGTGDRGMKWPELKGDSSSASEEGKNMWGYATAPPYASIKWYSITHKNNFTLYLLK